MGSADLMVVGGRGLLGRTLVRAAQGTGRSVVATHHHSGPGPEAVEWTRLDIGDHDALEAAVTAARPRALVNAAYVQHGDRLDEVTAIAPGRLAAAAAGVGARFVHLSSDVVFPGDQVRPHVESDPVGPITDYGRAKATAEAAVATADTGAVIIRTSLLWGGDGDGPQERLARDPSVTFFTNQVRCPLRVDRLAVAILELCDRREITGILHVAGADAVDRLTFARRLAPLVGADPAALQGTVDRSGTRPDHLVLDSSRARALLEAPLPGVEADTASA